MKPVTEKPRSVQKDGCMCESCSKGHIVVQTSCQGHIVSHGVSDSPCDRLNVTMKMIQWPTAPWRPPRLLAEPLTTWAPSTQASTKHTHKTTQYHYYIWTFTGVNTEIFTCHPNDKQRTSGWLLCGATTEIDKDEWYVISSAILQNWNH